MSNSMHQPHYNHPKIFLIGLPRTATTSLCNAMLNLGFKTAHTAYTQKTFLTADVIADTPVFCDYAQLDLHFPQSKFICTTRNMSQWVPSIKQLLQRMYTNLQRTDGGFNPYLKRCFNQTFSPLTLENIESDDFLQSCYTKHEQAVDHYFKDRSGDLLKLDVTQTNSHISLINYLIDLKRVPPEIDVNKHQFKQINKGGKVTAWNEIKHPYKVDSTRAGKVDKTLF